MSSNRTQGGPRRVGRGQRGTTLAVLIVALMPVAALVTVFQMRSHFEIRAHQSRKEEVRAVERCLAALEVARNQIINSNYHSGNNDRLVQVHQQTEASTLRPNPVGAGYLAFDSETGEAHVFTNADTTLLEPRYRPYRLLTTVDLEDGLDGEFDDAYDKIPIYAASIVGYWHVVEARAQVGQVGRTGRMFVRERDPFTRFAIFIDSHYQGISGSPKGDIHTNKKLQIFYPDAYFEDFASAHEGFQYLCGGSQEATTFAGGSNSASDVIQMPDINDIQNIKPNATGPYLVASTHDNVSVIFSGDQVRIAARRIATGETEVLHDGDLPSGGVIYAENSIVELEGDLDGRITVVSEGNVNITDSLRYVDADGDAARLNPDSPDNYLPNPDYEGSSALGVIGNGPVLYDPGIPDTFELHAAVFSSSGNVGLPGLTFTSNGAYVSRYDSSFQKQNLNVLGVTIADKRFVGTVVNSSGTVLSGFQDGSIEYDRSLLNRPPPHFLAVERPLFKGIEILEGSLQ